MKTKEFMTWLTNEKQLKSNVSTKVSNCKRVENEYGNLDIHYNLDKGASIRTLLKYSKEDEREKRPAKNNIAIKGNIYNVLASLRRDIKIYIEFKKFENKTNK